VHLIRPPIFPAFIIYENAGPIVGGNCGKCGKGPLARIPAFSAFSAASAEIGLLKPP
jgi:hypothetical protein